MTDAQRLAAAVFTLITRRLATRADDIYQLAGTTSSFEEWLNWEAYLACKQYQDVYPFAEVTAKPSYGGEGVLGDDGRPSGLLGDLRIGTGYTDDDRWVFAEFAVLHDGNRNGKWKEKIREDAAKLRRLDNYVESIPLLFVVVVSRGDVAADWGDYLTRFDVWAADTPYTFHYRLGDGGTLAVKAFDARSFPVPAAV